MKAQVRTPPKVTIDHELRFPVQGAGELIIGKSAGARCGTAVGFHLTVSWGIYGEVGGVMDAKVAKQLVNHILATLAARRTG